MPDQTSDGWKMDTEPLAAREERLHYVLTLYVAGMTRRSRAAVQSITDFCATYLPGHHELSIVDLYQDPDCASREQIVAAPTLIRSLPLPVRRLIGDMTDQDKVLVSLEVRPPV